MRRFSTSKESKKFCPEVTVEEDRAKSGPFRGKRRDTGSSISKVNNVIYH